MDRIIDKFYNGSMSSNFGFGTIGSKGPNIYTHKVMTPKPDPTKYTNNQTLFNANKSQVNINNLNSRYNASQTLFNNPVPKTQYSVGLQVPTTADPLLTRGVTIPFQPPGYTETPQNPYEPTKKYFKPEILKVHMLEQKIKEMEEKNKEDKRRMREIIEGNVLNTTQPPQRTQNIPNLDNNNMNNNPNSLEQAMENLRNQNAGLMDLSQKQALRRQQIQYELNQARAKLKNDRFFTGGGANSDEEEEEEEEESEEESDKLLNPEGGDGLLNLGARPDEKKTTKSSKMNKTSKHSDKKDENGKELTPAEEEANEFIHSIPDHVALKLQADNFKVRANLAQVKDGFRNIRNQLEDKLEALQMAQRLNFEKIRFIIEQGGSKKMNAGIKKLLDGEDIDINNVQEDTPEYIRNLPNLIEDKLRKNEERRKEEENQEKLEEQQMMDDEIGQRFNVTDENALLRFNPEDIKIDNVNENNPWEVVKEQNKYEYIPGRGVTMGNIQRANKSQLNQNTTQNQNQGRVFTEEQEDNLVNKIAEKIFRTMRDNQYATSPIQPAQMQPTQQMSIGDGMSGINKNEENEWLSNFDDEENDQKKKKKKKSQNSETVTQKSKNKKNQKNKINNKKKKIPLTSNDISEEDEENENEQDEQVDINDTKNKNKNRKNIKKTKQKNKRKIDEDEDEEENDNENENESEEDNNNEENEENENTEENEDEEEEEPNRKNRRKKNINNMTTKSSQINKSRSINQKKKNKK